ncbi:hypothetical protein [Paenibacillus tianjinensis]|uniref:XRE family transcriptional regulator n=1 Tax=Paenibacillus tianjinensis TaxID=2810347 RepID=A0ABX7L5G0_9BACL|nr:hypothetical protein [Paenibacillus tianjinensis]QSF43268.1 hypothetical protein JRJ22_18550 [Paenibacillus tianjinensis]
MRYHDSDHFFEQQGSLICWIRNELKMSIIDLANYTKYGTKEIDDFEQGYMTSEDVNKFYEECLKGLIKYANDSGQSFSEVLYHLSEVKLS